MEFDQLKKIWDSQNNRPLYGFDEQALHDRILSKQKKGNHITNISELLAVGAYVVTGCFIAGVNLYKQSGSIYMYILAAWMLCSAWFLFLGRLRRIRGARSFDRSMRGDLEHAVSLATYQVRLSLTMRWNILPIALLTALGLWDSGKSAWVAGGILIFFALASYAAGWEHGIYKSRKRELEILRGRLETEEAAAHP